MGNAGLVEHGAKEPFPVPIHLRWPCEESYGSHVKKAPRL
jgi:hypothetical protein